VSGEKKKNAVGRKVLTLGGRGEKSRNQKNENKNRFPVGAASGKTKKQTPTERSDNLKRCKPPKKARGGSVKGGKSIGKAFRTKRAWGGEFDEGEKRMAKGGGSSHSKGGSGGIDPKIATADPKVGEGGEITRQDTSAQRKALEATKKTRKSITKTVNRRRRPTIGDRGRKRTGRGKPTPQPNESNGGEEEKLQKKKKEKRGRGKGDCFRTR